MKINYKNNIIYKNHNCLYDSILFELPKNILKKSDLSYKDIESSVVTIINDIIEFHDPTPEALPFSVFDNNIEIINNLNLNMLFYNPKEEYRAIKKFNNIKFNNGREYINSEDGYHCFRYNISYDSIDLEESDELTDEINTQLKNRMYSIK